MKTNQSAKKTKNALSVSLMEIVRQGEPCRDEVILFMRDFNLTSNAELDAYSPKLHRKANGLSPTTQIMLADIYTKPTNIGMSGPSRVSWLLSHIARLSPIQSTIDKLATDKKAALAKAKKAKKLKTQAAVLDRKVKANRRKISALEQQINGYEDEIEQLDYEADGLNSDLEPTEEMLAIATKKVLGITAQSQKKSAVAKKQM